MARALLPLRRLDRDHQRRLRQPRLERLPQIVRVYSPFFRDAL